MKAAYYALHYGREYLAHSIRSIQDSVDQIFFFYSEKPSYGHASPVRCPDTREELRAEVDRFTVKPFYWIEGSWPHEEAHRNYAIDYMRQRGAEVVLVVDADELWAPGAASMAVQHVLEQNRARRWMARFTNFWRSFNWVVRDGFTPIRIADLRHADGSTADGHLPPDVQPVLHFGYAQREELMGYKWTCHGHQNELRPGWQEKFLSWTPETTDLHPCVNNLWDRAHRTSDEVMELVGQVAGDHPYFGLDLIR